MNKKNFSLLITDRNRHVCEFLKREMASEGYSVQIAISCKEIIKLIYNNNIPDILVLDPDLPDVYEPALLKTIFEKTGNIPIVLHTLNMDDSKKLLWLNIAGIIEKNETSIETLKDVILHITKEYCL
ncbi:MAG: response regulator [Desulfobacterales bacterium]|nr:response regulator [Desulfobacterales bacterium]